MKYIYTLIFLTLLGISIGSAQDYKVNYPKGKVWISGVDEIKIMGYSGSDVILTAPKSDHDKDDRSRGLKLINSLGLDDNTGMGISIKEEDGMLKVIQISNDCHSSCSSNDIVTLKVPNDVDLYVEHSTHDGDDIIISGIRGEIETSVNYNDIYLEDVTGPMAVKSVYGDVVAEFGTMSQSGSISIHSVYGLVDVSVPANVEADVSLKTPYGAVYSNVDIKVDTSSGQSSKNIKGEINGGGVDVTLKASYDNVYLRTK